MLEIFILFRLAKRIGKIIEEKGRKKGGYQVLLVVLWFGGEIFGAIVGGVITAIATENEEGSPLLAYAFALAGAIIGAVIAFQIAKHLEPLNGDEEEFYHGIDDADNLQAGEHFHARTVSPPSTTDAYTDNPHKAPRPVDERIQE